MSGTIHICSPARKVVAVVSDDRPTRHCFGCGKARLHEWEFVTYPDSYYEPTLRPKCVVCRQDNTCFPGRYYEGNPPVPESVVAAVRASLPVTENTE